MDVKCHHLCHSPVVQSKSGTLSTFKGQGLHIDVTASRWDNGIIIPSLSYIKHLKESSLGQGKNRAWLNPMISKEGVLTHINQDRRLFGHFYTFDNVFIFTCLWSGGNIYLWSGNIY